MKDDAKKPTNLQIQLQEKWKIQIQHPYLYLAHKTHSTIEELCTEGFFILVNTVKHTVWSDASISSLGVNTYHRPFFTRWYSTCGWYPRMVKFHVVAKLERRVMLHSTCNVDTVLTVVDKASHHFRLLPIGSPSDMDSLGIRKLQ